jgi:putative membrane protein
MTYKGFLLASFVAVWTWAAIKPAFREDWLLENYLVFLFFPLILFAGRYFELSNVSYTLIALFGTLHVIGSHYTYSLVPFGYTLQHWFGSERKHFSFGFSSHIPCARPSCVLPRSEVSGVTTCPWT